METMNDFFNEFATKDYYINNRTNFYIVWCFIGTSIATIMITCIFFKNIALPVIFVVFLVYAVIFLIDFVLRLKNNVPYNSPMIGFSMISIMLSLLFVLSMILLFTLPFGRTYKSTTLTLFLAHLFFSLLLAILLFLLFAAFTLDTTNTPKSSKKLFASLQYSILISYLFVGVFIASYGSAYLQEMLFNTIKATNPSITFQEAMTTFNGVVLKEQIDLYRTLFISASFPSFYILLKSLFDTPTKNYQHDNCKVNYSRMNRRPSNRRFR